MNLHPPSPTVRSSFTLAVTVISLATPTGNSATYPEIILTDRPVAYYRLEETGDSPIAIDGTTNHFDGTYIFDSGPQGTFPQQGLPGITTNSILFRTYTDSGVRHSSDIVIPFNAALNPASSPTNPLPFSVEMWAQPTTQPADYSVPLASFGRYVNGSPIYANASGWNFYQSPGPNSFWIFNLKPAAFGQATTVPITLFQWYHLVATFDGTNAVFYVNGVPRGTYSGRGYIPNPDADMHIGTGANTGFLPFSGGVDEVAVYGSALSSNQVFAHYQSGTNSFRAVPTPGSIVLAPVSASVLAGTSVTFSVTASGTAPLRYYWLRGNSIIPNATNNSISFTAAYPADDGATFSVVVTNLYGGTNSVPVTLTVLTNLDIVREPFSITRTVGSHAAFRVVATGPLPLTYQWFKGATSISGATNDTLWLSKIQTSDSAPYHVRVTTPFGAKNSADADLTVQPRAVTVPVTGYAKVIMAENPVAYWRLDEAVDSPTAVDAAGSFDGSYLPANGTFTYGAKTGIPGETDTALGMTGGATVRIPYALELNPVTGPWSVEAWVQPKTLDPANFRTVFSSMWNSDFGNHVFGWNVYQHVAGVWTLNIFNGGGSSTFVSDFTHNPLVPGNWYHLVITDDLTTIRFIVNGVQVGSSTIVASKFAPNGVNGDATVAGGPTVLGQRSDNAFAPFDGALDDVAFYNQALPLSTVQAHYAASVRLTISKSGASVIVTWPAGTLQESAQVNGPYANVTPAVSPQTIIATNSARYYRVNLQ